ncbi:MAG: hypothetical protein ACKPKO_50270, partial [Candidatus Fonsibacter sp.]
IFAEGMTYLAYVAWFALAARVMAIASVWYVDASPRGVVYCARASLLIDQGGYFLEGSFLVQFLH